MSYLRFDSILPSGVPLKSYETTRSLGGLAEVAPMSDALKAFAAALSIFSFFLLMSRIDFIVHGTLYHHGLQFSYAWANEYWIMYIGTFIAFSVAISLMYWLGSNKTARDLKFSLGLFATVIILAVTALEDVMVYLLWAGGLPPADFVWWWAPWIHLFGTWTTTMQLLLTLAGIFATILLWIRLTWKSSPRSRCTPS